MNHLREITGYDNLVTATDLIEATSDTGVFMSLSSVMKRAAMKLSKICNDLRLLSSGPQAGLGEINLPARQAGSSIMPGKVNPVIPEAVSQVAFVIAGSDVTVAFASEAGQLQLNAFEPVMMHTIMQNSTWLRRAMRTLRVNCIAGITANADKTEAQVAASVGLITALNPVIGYAAASKIAKQALASHENVADLVVAEGLLDRERVTQLLQPEALAGKFPEPTSVGSLTAEEIAEQERRIDSLDPKQLAGHIQEPAN
jgi:aspartate ammonia-lyase